MIVVAVWSGSFKDALFFIISCFLAFIFSMNWCPRCNGPTFWLLGNYYVFGYVTLIFRFDPVGERTTATSARRGLTDRGGVRHEPVVPTLQSSSVTALLLALLVCKSCFAGMRFGSFFFV